MISSNGDSLVLLRMAEVPAVDPCELKQISRLLSPLIALKPG